MSHPPLEPTDPHAEVSSPANGDLLDLARTDPEACAKKMMDDWNRSWEEIKDYNEQWKLNLWRSAGYLGAQWTKVQDRQEARLPLGSQPSVAGLNEALKLRQRLRSYIFADRALPDVFPTSGQDEDADRADFSARVLLDQCSEGKLDYNLLMGDAFDLAGDYGSAFVHCYVEPEGGGSQLLKIRAHPDAQDEQNPLLEAEVLAGQVPQKEYILRFVRKDGTLTDEKEPGLRRQWLPKLCGDILTGRHVRFLPGTSRDLWDAEAVQIGALVAVRVAKQAFPEFFQDLSNDDLAAIVQERPKQAKDLLPPEQRRYLTRSVVDDDSLIFVLTRYHRASRLYPKGAYLVAIGESRMAYPLTEDQGAWWDEEHDEAMDIPLTQLKHYPRFGNPYGAGAMELLGPGNEIIGLLLSYMLEHMDRFADRKTFVPLHSNLRPEQLDVETATYIPYSGQSPPVAEQVPDFPKMVTDLYLGMKRDLADVSGLQQTGQALNDPSVTSGKQANIILQQVNVLLSDLREQTERALVRGWRVMLQLMRARFTTPQLSRFKGEDGLHYEREWSGTDLLGTADVQVARGSFTQMSPALKAATARELYAGDKVLQPQEYRRIIMEAMGPRLALEDDPHRERCQRQIARWKDGPPEGWQPQTAPVDTMTGQPVVDPQTGQPAQAPPDPILSALFAPLPVDQVQGVAQMRMELFGRVIASVAFERHPPAWQQALLQAFEAARQAAGVPTVQEQQQAQAQAQQAQQQAEAAKEAQKAGLDVEKAKIEAAADVQEAEIRNRGDVLDIAAARASQGG